MGLFQEQPVPETALNSHAIDSNEAETTFQKSTHPTFQSNTEAFRQSDIKNRFEIEEHPVDQVRDVKVGIIGAGLSGVTAAILLRAKLPGIDVTIFDKNGDIVSENILLPYFEDDRDLINDSQGGTWFENTYPGVRCDIPAHVYQSNFEPNTQWSEEFAQGHEIRDYWQGLAKKYDIYANLKSKQKILRVEWISEETKWKLTIQDLINDKVKAYDKSRQSMSIGLNLIDRYMNGDWTLSYLLLDTSMHGNFRTMKGSTHSKVHYFTHQIGTIMST